MAHQEPPNDVRVETDVASAIQHQEAMTQQPHILADSAASIAGLLTGLIRGVKVKTGPWHPDLSSMHVGSHRKDDNSLAAIERLKESLNFTEAVREALVTLMRAPMFLLKEAPSQESSGRRKRQTNDQLRFLSPRLFPLFDDPSPRLLSPDFFSFFESQNSVGSLPSLLDGLRPKEKLAWLEFVGELSGASDYFRWMQTEEFKQLLALHEQQQRLIQQGPEGVPVSKDSPLGKVGDLLEPVSKAGTVGEFLLSLSNDQWHKLNQRGYAFLEPNQLESVYGSDMATDMDYWPFDIQAYSNWTDQDRMANVIPAIVASMVADEDASHTRWKRQADGNSTGPTFATPTILAPSVGPAFVNVIFLKAPTILSPAVFTPIINGPLVLSPYILSAYVFSPFIIAPQVLTPFILNPFVLSPDILEPFVLSPAILSPTVLSPFILDPYVLSPPILSPSVGSPNILSPTVLSPAILSPSTLTATILSPGVLSPSILSPSDGPSILSPCALCRRKRKRR